MGRRQGWLAASPRPSWKKTSAFPSNDQRQSVTPSPTHDARRREGSSEARAIGHHPRLQLKRPTPSTIEHDTPTTAP